MELKRGDNDDVEMHLSEAELDVFQAGIREMLEALEDWEFQTRAGFEREHAVAVLTELIGKRKSL